MKPSIYNCNVIELSKIHNRAGNITPVHGGIEVPFDIKRIYYLYDVPSGETRGGHANKQLQQLIVAASGSFDVLLDDDGRNKKIVTLNRPNFGLYVTPLIRRELIKFSSRAVLLVLASMKYTEDDYFRNYSDYLNFMKI